MFPLEPECCSVLVRTTDQESWKRHRDWLTLCLGEGNPRAAVRTKAVSYLQSLTFLRITFALIEVLLLSY